MHTTSIERAGQLTGPGARTAPAELQPPAYGPQANAPSWSCAAAPGRLGLDRGTLAWFARFREQDEAGRQHLVRTQALTPRQADALLRLERNLLELGCPGAWFEETGSTQPVRVQVELLRPATGYVLSPEDRQAALRMAAGESVEASSDLHQRLARTVLVSDILGVALR